MYGKCFGPKKRAQYHVGGDNSQELGGKSRKSHTHTHTHTHTRAEKGLGAWSACGLSWKCYGLVVVFEILLPRAPGWPHNLMPWRSGALFSFDSLLAKFGPLLALPYVVANVDPHTRCILIDAEHTLIITVIDADWTRAILISKASSPVDSRDN